MAESVREILRLVFTTSEGKTTAFPSVTPRVTWRNLVDESVSHVGN
jgi:hypothetical protein